MECLGASGLDFLILDSEHGPFEAESCADLVRAACLRNITPLARIKDCSRPSVLKMLDIGVQGLIVPCVNTVEEVHNLVDYAKYYPVGNRGVMWGRDAIWGEADYASHGLNSYFETCNRETLLIPQCETAGCLAHIEEITQIDGVDGIFIGPFDLSISLGIPGQFHAPRFQEAVERIVRAFHGADKPVYMYAGTAEESRARLAAGIDGVASSLTSGVLVDAYRKLVDAIKA